MRRIHLFEFEDQPLLPQALRELVTDLLAYQLSELEVYTPVLPRLRGAMESVGEHRILDLCSGSGGQWAKMFQELERSFEKPLELTLSDKYPNATELQRICARRPQQIRYIDTSVDALRVGNHPGFRTLFTAFHHFRPAQARQILQSAVDDEAPIGIFEFTERSLANLLTMPILAPLLTALQTPWIRPVRWRRFALTYGLPVAPVLYTWDALISHMRTYSVSELRDLVQSVKRNHTFEWESGQISHPKARLKLTYLIGIPKAAVVSTRAIKDPPHSLNGTRRTSTTIVVPRHDRPSL